MSNSQIYYFTSPDRSLFLIPNGDSSGYIVSDKQLGMAIWFDKEKAMSMGHLLGITYDGWILQEGNRPITDKYQEKDTL